MPHLSLCYWGGGRGGGSETRSSRGRLKQVTLYLNAIFYGFTLLASVCHNPLPLVREWGLERLDVRGGENKDDCIVSRIRTKSSNSH